MPKHYMHSKKQRHSDMHMQKGMMTVRIPKRKTGMMKLRIAKLKRS
jgi:hypothetical protein